jgi:hypothetical protein
VTVIGAVLALSALLAVIGVSIWAPASPPTARLRAVVSDCSYRDSGGVLTLQVSFHALAGSGLPTGTVLLFASVPLMHGLSATRDGRTVRASQGDTFATTGEPVPFVVNVYGGLPQRVSIESAELSTPASGTLRAPTLSSLVGRSVATRFGRVSVIAARGVSGGVEVTLATRGSSGSAAIRGAGPDAGRLDVDGRSFPGSLSTAGPGPGAYVTTLLFMDATAGADVTLRMDDWVFVARGLALTIPKDCTL